MKLVVHKPEHQRSTRQSQEQHGRQYGHGPRNDSRQKLGAGLGRFFMKQRAIGRDVVYGQIWPLNQGGEKRMQHKYQSV